MSIQTLSILFLGFVLLTSCASPATPTSPPVLPTSPLSNTAVPFPLTVTPGAVTPLPGVTITSAPGIPNTSGMCTDPQVTALIDSFNSAVLNSDGGLLSSLVSPTRGMDVAFLRDGTVITYDQEHAKFLFETTFEVDWGVMPGSGLAKKGPFHDVVVPELVKTFSQPYSLHCNELKLGGATYEADWPYEGEYYSVHFPGTEANGNMDWQTWVLGVEKVNNKPYIYALMHFFWEP
ncbi:MAG TPA: hypothetical protein VHP14_16100 [Anaerolineales bacterium]|nr:hypothetical protein [Anaerolineales bacterium]